MKKTLDAHNFKILKHFFKTVLNAYINNTDQITMKKLKHWEAFRKRLHNQVQALKYSLPEYSLILVRQYLILGQL